LFLGLIGGLLGAFFIYVNYSINKLRKKYIDTKLKKVLETVSLVFVTSTVIFFAPMIMRYSCFDNTEGNLETIQYLCSESEYNPLATFLFNPEGNVIKAFLD
jgi:H+/Cl- antiporter ClcA